MSPPAAATPPADDRKYWLALWRTPGVGPSTFQRLLEQFGSPRSVFDAGTVAWRTGSLTDVTQQALRHPDWSAVDLDLEWLEQENNHLIVSDDPAYPGLLTEIGDAPPLLFVHGDPGVLGLAQLAIVGSRNPTPTGRDTAFEFARHLSGAGLVISSGLALGIDAAAHRGALAGAGRTVAVAGTGLDRVYPARHRQLAHDIAARGALVSEFPPGTPARPENFPRRNRILSGLGIGTLVVEAAPRSGSLITARLAGEQGREVFAIPGSIHNPLARGCHRLIRQGAKLVETAQDVLEELGPLSTLTTAPRESHPGQDADPVTDQQYTDFLEHLGYEPVTIDRLVERSGLTPDAVSSMLLVLELHGYVAAVAGGRYTRIS